MKSLYTKFVLYTIVTMLCSGMLSFWLANEYYQKKLKPVNDAKNMRIALDIANFAHHNPTMNLNDYLKSTAAIGYQFYIVSEDGKENYYGAKFRKENLTKKDIHNVLSHEIYHGILNFPQSTFVTGFFSNELKNSIGVPLEHNGKKYALFMRPNIKLLFSEIHALLGILFMLTFFLSIIFVFIGTNYLVKPIRTLTSATKKLANGQFDVTLDVSHKDEIGTLAKSFAHMATQLEKTDEKRKEFISNVSHDIQSPLANIKGYTNLLAQSTLEQAQKEQYITIINSEITRLSDLTKQLLLLTSLDQKKKLMHVTPINISQQLIHLIRQHQWAMGQKGLLVSHTLRNNCFVDGDATLLNTLFDNLITNAIKYNRDGGRIDISLNETADSYIIQFEDTGIGMTPEEQLHIFERFYRADSSRTYTIAGTGLGLSIAKSVADLHDGTISVISAIDTGSTFTISLPKSHQS